MNINDEHLYNVICIINDINGESTSIIDQRVVILTYYFKSWIIKVYPSYNNDYTKLSSPIIILCMFKKYLKDNYKSLPKSLLDYFNDFIDNKSRYIYLTSKYKKKWLDNCINKKLPINLYDLELNPINPHKYYINYIDYKERKRYLFTFNDFKKIACSSLQHCYAFDIIPEPMHIKNPYTNKKFTSVELANINKKLYDMPPVWNMFVESKFNIFNLKKNYNYHLIPLCIPSYVDQLSDDDIIQYFEDLFDEYDINYCEECLIRDHKDIGTQKVKDILIEWVKCINFNNIMSRDTIEKVRHIYGLLYCPHNNIQINDPNNILNILNEKEEEKEFLLNIDFIKPLFCAGYKDKNDKKLYIKRQREKAKKREKIERKNKVKEITIRN